jgi:opacity protein-like surface antigen
MARKAYCVALGAFFSLLIGVAQAADLPTTKGPPPAPPQPVPVFTWTGAYSGSNIGVGFLNGRADPACINPAGVSLGTGCAIAPSFQLNTAGFIGGAQSGYNLQYNNFVVGIETDIQGAGIQKTSSVTGTFPQVGGGTTGVGTITTTDRLNYFGTVRGRVGVAFDRTLLYATGGLIYGDVNDSYQRVFPAVSFVGSSDTVRFGAVVGAGVEYAFTEHWSGKIEGLYYDFGSHTLLAGTLPAGFNAFQTGFRFRDNGEIARVGLNYKFW